MFYSNELLTSCNSLYETGLATSASTLSNILDVNRIMSNFSHNFFTSYENWLALMAFLKMEHFAKDEFSRESYWAGWTAGYILNQLLITQSDDEFDL